MIFKVLSKNQLAALFELLAVNVVVGPTRVGTNRHGKSLYDFKVVANFDELALDYTPTIHRADDLRSVGNHRRDQGESKNLSADEQLRDLSHCRNLAGAAVHDAGDPDL